MADYSAGNLYLNIDSVANDTLKDLDAVIGRLNLINSGLGKISKVGKGKSNKISFLDYGNGKNSLSSLFNIGKWTAVLYSAKRLGGYVAQIAQHGADYTETLNLWETAMGSNLTVATEFVNKMNEAYGISEKTLMNAQAIFKNMLGSLGQISDTMAYSLSEGITQMALDYASLYNVTFEQAFTKFQAALAGQVRPIRSVAGYDITETTLFQLYQQLGGTKTMRQLNRTEKQLLAILAIFNQMDKSGAIGDLEKTMPSFANQSRVMAESWQRVLTYSGTLITHLIESTGVMTYLNAVLIFAGDTLKAVAESMDAIKSFADPFESTTEGALDASKAIDEVNGKLLGFDKFRSLSGGGQENALGLDEKVLEALSQFDSILGSASMEAKTLAEQFKIASGLFNEDGAFNKNAWDELTEKIIATGTAVGGVLAIFYAFKIGATLVPLFSNLALGIMEIMTTTKGLTSNVTLLGKAFSFLLNHPILTVLIAIGAYLLYLYFTNEKFRTSVNELFQSFVPLFNLLFNLIEQIIKPIGTLLGSTLGIADEIFILIVKLAIPVIQALMVILIPFVYVLEAVIKALSSIVEILNALFTFNFSGLGNKLGEIWGGKWASYDFSMGAINQWSGGEFARGGLPDKGSAFVAGEDGAEYVYNMPSGQSGVANVQQIAQATYSGTMRALNDWWGGRNAREDIPQLTEANPTGMYQAVTGVARAQGKVWSKA